MMHTSHYRRKNIDLLSKRIGWFIGLILLSNAAAQEVTEKVIPLNNNVVQTASPNVEGVHSMSLKSVKMFLPAFPDIKSPYWIAIDAQSKIMIGGKDIHARIEPASMTKVMTAYLVFQALREGKINKEDQVKSIKHTEGSRMFLNDTGKVKVEDLLYGMIVQSGNDAAMTLAQMIAGSEKKFADLMNATAQQMGMTKTHFVNASGLPDAKHYTTLYDLSILAMTLLSDFPQEYKIFGEKEFSYNNIRQLNRNALLWREIGVDGIKTGHTRAAGFCLMISAIRGDRRIIVITAKAATERQRFEDGEALVNYIYDYTETIKLYDTDQPVDRLQVWKGTEVSVPVGFSKLLYLTIPVGMQAKLGAKLSHQQKIIAPIKPGDILGTLRLSLDGKPYAEYPVIALQEVGKASWFRLLWHNIQLWFDE